MPAATAAAFTGIHNENEFYSHHYLSEIVLPHVAPDQRGLPDTPGPVDDDHPSGRDRAREPR